MLSMSSGRSIFRNRPNQKHIIQTRQKHSLLPCAENLPAATYTYNINGSRESLSYANGNVTTYSYNLANWLTGMSNKKGEEVISSFT